MRNGTPATVVALAMVGTLYFIGSWLPDQIEREHAKIASINTVATNIKTLSSSGVPQELLDYIREQRELSRTRDDHANGENEPVMSLKLDEQMPSDSILADKFKNFFTKPVTASGSDEFIVTPGLEDPVRFWSKIFGEFGRDQIVFYHPDDVGIVYSVLDFSELKNFSDSIGTIRDQMIAEERERVLRMIRKVTRLFKKPVLTVAELDVLDAEEARLYEILRKKHLDSVADGESLVKSLAYRSGFAHRIQKALIQSGRYLPEMQRIFLERGLPLELTMIPFIESTFHVKAYSRSRAAGVWQFIPQTGSRYLRIDEFVDERYDPILATHAAASHLAHEYGFLKSWPLTVNAYNTGPGRMQDAVKKLGTDDIAVIIQKYDGAGYGFDSRNYYPEFLAMLHVYQNREQLFGEMDSLPLEDYEYIVMPATTNLPNLINMAGVDENLIHHMNPGFSNDVVSGRKALPKGYLLKVPPQLKDGILLAAKELYQNRLYASYHVVKPGEDLGQIAKHYGVNARDMAKLNQVLSPSDVRVGDILKLPVEDFETKATAALPGQRPSDFQIVPAEESTVVSDLVD